MPKCVPKQEIQIIQSQGATIKSGGCGPSSVRNLGNNLLGWNTSIPAVAQIAVACGARYDGGTTTSTLLQEMQRRRGGFIYQYTKVDERAFSAGAIRALFENAGFTVEWDGTTKTVIVKK